MLKNLLKKKDGFTIVEVMIVLAIAGLIILVVFLAVPALQRNSRNTQRSTDIGVIGAAVNECLNNRNGSTTACAPATLTTFLDTTKLRQITSISGAGLESAAVNYNTACNADGSGTGGAANKKVAITYQIEGASAPISRCQEV